jgi:ABC-type transport system involved in multi-copper enzyme maturation permease subunit
VSHSILQVWRADFYNRSRQTSYLVILLLMLLLTLFFFPVTDANYQTLEINGYRGIYNSAWMGATLATLQVVFLPIICFYLIKNSVESDRNLAVSDLIAATPISKISFLAGKWLSNLSLLLGIALVMLVTTVFVQLWIGEDYQIQLLAYL